MKNRILFYGICLLMFASCNKKPITSGSLHWDIDYQFGEEFAEQVAAAPKTMIVNFAEGKAQWTPAAGNGRVKTVIQDHAAKTEIQTVETKGTLYAVNTYMPDGEVSSGPLDGSKEIAGYKCKKGWIKPGRYDTLIVWYTQEIDLIYSPIGKIDGCVMEFSLETPNGPIVQSVSKVESKKHEEALFRIPPGLNVLTADQYQDKIQGTANLEGASFPQTSWTTLDGKKQSTSDLNGKVTVVNFWFINCGPCRKEMPDLKKLANKYKNDPEVEFLAFALDTPAELKPFMASNDFGYTVVPDSRPLASQVGIGSFPTNFIVDKSGKVQNYTLGLLPNILEVLDEGIVDAKRRK